MNCIGPAQSCQTMPGKTLRQAKRAIIAIIGFTVVMLGVVMLVTPGPGWPFIFLGLSILAVEYVWARNLLKRLKKAGNAAAQTIFGRSVFRRERSSPSPESE